MKEGSSSEGNKGRRRGGSCREKEEEEKETKRRKRRRRGRKRRKEEEEKERRKRRRKRSLRTGVEWTTASSRAGLNASGRWWPRGRRRKTSQPRSGVISFRARSVLVAGELKVEWRRLQGLHPRQISGATLAAGSQASSRRPRCSRRGGLGMTRGPKL